MSRIARRVAAAWLMLIAPAGALRAQEPATSFDQLRLRLKAGDTVTVNDTSGHVIRGQIATISSSSIAILWKAGGTTLAEGDVTTIRRGTRGSLVKGAAWGLGIGSAAGLVGWAGSQIHGSLCECSSGNSARSVAMFAALGAGIGIASAARVREKVVFLRTGDGRGGPSAAAEPKLTVSPLVTRSQRGVRVNYRF